MEISNYIISKTKPFQMNDLIDKAQRFFNKNIHTHFPVINEGVYMGCLQAEDTFTFDKNKSIGEFLYLFERFYVRDSAMWLEVLEAFAQNNTDLMPVLNAENQFLGFYELNAIFNVLTDTPFIKEIGGSIVVQTQARDYSMSQIAQIVEGNNSKILGSIISFSDEQSVQVTLKIVSGNMNEIIQTFRRYNYEIISNHQDDTYIEKLTERSAYLDKYLSL
jgi:predicted transcriptional regulator